MTHKGRTEREERRHQKGRRRLCPAPLDRRKAHSSSSQPSVRSATLEPRKRQRLLAAVPSPLFEALVHILIPGWV